MSIVEVAKRARVSSASVSRFINGSGSVSAEKEQRIRAAMEAISYTPSGCRPGPKLSSRVGMRTGNIVFLALGQRGGGGIESMFRMPVFPELLSGIQQGVSKRGFHLGFVQYSGKGPIPWALSPAKTDGILIHGSLDQMSTALRDALRAVPSVWLMRQHSDYAHEFDHVFYDNQAVGLLAARYLLGRRHRHVAFITPDPSHQAFAARRDTFEEVIEVGGGRCMVLELTPKEVSSSPVAGLSRVVDELVSAKDRPTAVFVPSDNHLLGVYNLLKLKGVDPQCDMDLIGCNNDAMFLSQMHPRPATIDIRLDLVGRRGVDQLLLRMRKPTESSRKQIFISPVLVPGGK